MTEESEFQQSRRLDFEPGKAGGEGAPARSRGDAAGFKGQDAGKDENRFFRHLRFTELKTKGAYLIELDKLEDERGFFARSFCTDTFKEIGICETFVQCNISFNRHAGTLRGMHFQIGEESEAKLIRCTRGKIFDAIIDLRPDSPTFKEWVGVELSEENGSMLYVPEHFAHGFLTLADNTELFYQMSTRFAPGAARGLHWNDPEIGITWPSAPQVISEKDQNNPLLKDCFEVLA